MRPSAARPLAKVVTFVAAAGIATVALFTPPHADLPRAEVIKPAPISMSIFAERADGSRTSELVPGGALAAGDSLRFRISTDRGGSLSLIGLDGGAGHPLFPFRDPGGRSWRIPRR